MFFIIDIYELFVVRHNERNQYEEEQSVSDFFDLKELFDRSPLNTEVCTNFNSVIVVIVF